MTRKSPLKKEKQKDFGVFLLGLFALILMVCWIMILLVTVGWA